jgi:hypothetical protein
VLPSQLGIRFSHDAADHTVCNVDSGPVRACGPPAKAAARPGGRLLFVEKSFDYFSRCSRPRHGFAHGPLVQQANDPLGQPHTNDFIGCIGL